MKKILFLLFILPLSVFSQDNNYISNQDYNEFVTYVRDSLLRLTMGEEVDEEGYVYVEKDSNSKKWEIVGVKWKIKFDVNWPESREALEPWHYKTSERLNRKRQFDTRKFLHNGVKVYLDELVWC